MPSWPGFRGRQWPWIERLTCEGSKLQKGVASICFYMTLPQSPAVTSWSPATLCKALVTLKQPDSGCPLCTYSGSTAWDVSTLQFRFWGQLLVPHSTSSRKPSPCSPPGTVPPQRPHSSSCGCHCVALWNGIHRA